MPAETLPVLVAACGNLMAGDDAFGPWVARRLREMPPDHAEIVDLGMQPTGLLDHLDRRRAILIVDAALANPAFPTGTLVDMDFFSPDRPQLVHDLPLSSHGLSIAHELELAAKLQMLPEQVVLVAAAIDEASVGASISCLTKSLIPAAADRIRALVQRITSQQLGS